MWDETFDISRQVGDENPPCDGFDPAMLQFIHIFTASQPELREIKFTKKVSIQPINIPIIKVLRKHWLTGNLSISLQSRKILSSLRTAKWKGGTEWLLRFDWERK